MNVTFAFILNFILDFAKPLLKWSSSFVHNEFWSHLHRWNFWNRSAMSRFPNEWCYKLVTKLEYLTIWKWFLIPMMNVTFAFILNFILDFAKPLLKWSSSFVHNEFWSHLHRWNFWNRSAMSRFPNKCCYKLVTKLEYLTIRKWFLDTHDECDVTVARLYVWRFGGCEPPRQNSWKFTLKPHSGINTLGSSFSSLTGLCNWWWYSVEIDE